MSTARRAVQITRTGAFSDRRHREERSQRAIAFLIKETQEVQRAGHRICLVRNSR